jgi:hypothetical protein
LTCGTTGVIYVNPTQLCATPQRCAMLEDLFALPGSPESPVTSVVDGHMLVEKFCNEEGLYDDQTEDHQDLGWNDATVTFDTFVIDFNDMTKNFESQSVKSQSATHDPLARNAPFVGVLPHSALLWMRSQ